MHVVIIDHRELSLNYKKNRMANEFDISLNSYSHSFPQCSSLPTCSYCCIHVILRNWETGKPLTLKWWFT